MLSTHCSLLYNWIGRPTVTWLMCPLWTHLHVVCSVEYIYTKVYKKCIMLLVSKPQWTTPYHYCNYRLSSSWPCCSKSGTTVTLVAWMYFTSPAWRINPVARRCVPLLNDWWAYSSDSRQCHIQYNVYATDSVMVQAPYLYKRSWVVINRYYSLVIERVNASHASQYHNLRFGERGNRFCRCM